jgi:hypothetical protein
MTNDERLIRDLAESLGNALAWVSGGNLPEAHQVYRRAVSRIATVITPAEPSELDRLRARVKDLEEAANDFKRKVVAAWPLMDSENPKQMDVYMSLHELQSILNKTTKTPDQQ